MSDGQSISAVTDMKIKVDFAIQSVQMVIMATVLSAGRAAETFTITVSSAASLIYGEVVHIIS